GAALALGALWPVAAARTERGGRSGRGFLRWVVAFAAVLVYSALFDVLLSLREGPRHSATDLPLHPVLRQSELPRPVNVDVRAALTGCHTRLAILIPASISHAVDLGSGRVGGSDEAPRRYELEQVLDEGRSLRAQVANVDSAVFVHDYEPGRDGWDYFLSRS